MPTNAHSSYRGRIAPTPTGQLHRGHARAFGVAWARARAAKGALVYRLEDLDEDRCKAAYASQAIADLHWLGLDWDEATEAQSARNVFFGTVWQQLYEKGAIYPSAHSRKDVQGGVNIMPV